jgi:protoheme ferro-lyase
MAQKGTLIWSAVCGKETWSNVSVYPNVIMEKYNVTDAHCSMTWSSSKQQSSWIQPACGQIIKDIVLSIKRIKEYIGFFRKTMNVNAF